MTPRILCILAFTTLTALWLRPAHAEVTFDWQAPFTTPEQNMLTTWVEETLNGVEALVGPLPFDVHIRMYRRDGSAEPVPWANTRRGRRQGVNFHVDPGYELAAFQRDWTAAHELSHLILPYLGEKNAWFAEGFASYMQYQVMMATGQLTAGEARERYRDRFSRARNRYPFHNEPFAQAAPQLRQARAYPVMYWGGAAYFLQVDEMLQDMQGSSLSSVLASYLACCRRDTKNLESLVATLDRLSDSHIFSTHLQRFRTEPGFPSFDMRSTD
jgi:hypothetical protein